MAELIFSGQMDVYSIHENKPLRSCGHLGDLSELGEDEYYTFSLCVQNNGNQAFTWKQAYVRVDDGEAWHWASGTLGAFTQSTFHVYHCNMKKCMVTGTHTVTWYFDDKAVFQDRFTFTRSMERMSVFRFPAREEIELYQNGNTRRSPYIAAHLEIPKNTRYTEYMIDFKGTHIPKGTYCCLGCWAMDHTALKKNYKHVSTEDDWANAYAGLQKIYTGRTTSIMSFWDIFCTDALGRETTIEAKILYPESVINGGRFDGEGIGARCSAYFDWKPNHWYQMHLKCYPTNDTTIVEQWICDLETGDRTIVSAYDICVANSAFKGGMCVFLENFLPEAAGEVRAMEVCNARYLDEDTGKWHPVTQVYITPQDGIPAFEGSYDFGVDTQGHIWMITSGVGGDWFNNGKGKKGTYFSIPQN